MLILKSLYLLFLCSFWLIFVYFVNLCYTMYFLFYLTHFQRSFVSKKLLPGNKWNSVSAFLFSSFCGTTQKNPHFCRNIGGINIQNRIFFGRKWFLKSELHIMSKNKLYSTLNKTINAPVAKYSSTHIPQTRSFLK